MKFALVTADLSHKTSFKINYEHGDCTSFMNWVGILDGIHLSYYGLREEDNSYLKDFDVVMMSGNNGNYNDIARISKLLKDSDCVSMFYPEGSLQLHESWIGNLNSEYFEAMRSCDIVSIAEEDKASYYRSFLGPETLVRFIHVPTTPQMDQGTYFMPRKYKQNYVVVYGDNNPNHPAVAMACANRLKLPVFGVAVDTGKAPVIKRIFPDMSMTTMGKLSQLEFLRLLGFSIIHFYPTEWIGTARQQIACAAVGTPCIGNHDSHTQRRLYPPSLAHDIYDVDGMCDSAVRLLKDESAYNHVASQALRLMKFYSLENTKQRFMAAVEEARAAKKKATVTT